MSKQIDYTSIGRFDVYTVQEDDRYFTDFYEGSGFLFRLDGAMTEEAKKDALRTVLERQPLDFGCSAMMPLPTHYVHTSQEA